MKLLDACRTRHNQPPHHIPLRVLEGQPAQDFLTHRWPAMYTHDPDATPYQSPRFLRAWASLLPANSVPLILVAEGPAPAALALTLSRTSERGQPTRIQPLGSPHAEQVRPVGPGAHHPAVAHALARYLGAAASSETHVVVPDLPTHTHLGHILQAQPAWQHRTVDYATVPLPVQYANMSPSTRREHARRERTWAQLAADGRVLYSRTRTQTELAAATAIAEQLHQRRWAGHPVLHDADPGALLEVVRRIGPQEALVASLRLDNTPVAAAVCLYRGDTCYSVLPAMAPDHPELAFGHALTRLLTNDLARSGYRRLDLGRTLPDPGQHRYKTAYLCEWTTTLTAEAGTW
ncbi:GNAT family N-acetyltransferase [Streptomyces noursei]|uniref:GNAT family N-acetyltransferase n=1 Tax=Streptomyces noursei TaxID=1971 RepID=UPI00081CD45A|nr:Acetyltransferase [Streptomyces noursei ATCC 11455]ANZ21924.1 Acetyltransferase (GNAT) domain [Streptomyces noursei ATCC 11455]MCZ0996520.1 GNAT family N-acetyltransferase [Streptomyces noursei]